MTDGTRQSSASGSGSDLDTPPATLLLRTLDALPVLVSYVDADERYRFCNRAYEQWFGQPRAELIGRTVREVIGEAAYQAVQPSVRAVLAGQAVRLEQVLPYERAGSRLVEVLYSPDFRADGTVEGYIVLVRDVTEQRRRDEALRRSRSFELAMLGTPDAIWDWDVSSDAVQWSSGLTTRFGWVPPPPESGMRWGLERVHPEDVARVEGSLRSAMEGDASSWHGEYRFRRADGTWADVVDRCCVLRDKEGKAVRLAGTLQDVSERQALLHAVAQRSAELEAVLQAIPDAMYVAEGEHVQWVNTEALAAFGLDRAELLRTPWATLRERHAVRDPETHVPIPPEEGVLARALEGRTGHQEVLFHHATRGEDRVMRISAAPVRVEGRSAGAVMVMVDVTEQRRMFAALRAAQERLARGEQRLSTLVEALPVGVWMADETGRLMRANAEARRIWGVAGTEGPGHYRDFHGRWEESGVPVGPEEWPLASSLRTGAPVREQRVRIEAFDGMERLVRISGVPLHDASGHRFGAVSILEDVTEQRRLERERDEAAAQLRSLFAAAPAGIALLDAELRYVRVNDAYAAIAGRHAAEYPGRTPHEAIPGIAPRVEPFYRRVLETGEPLVGMEVTAPSPREPESIRTWLASYYPVRDAAGRVQGVGVVVMDITEQRRAEEQMRRTVGFRDMFLSIVSHDLRTPLQAVKLAVRSLLGMPELPAPAQRLVERIGASADRMNGMIVQLLDFARGRLGGGIPVEPRPMDLAECARHALDELRVARPEVQARFLARGDCRGEWDRDRLAQVVQNLVGNALKYGTPGTTEVELEGTPDEVRLTVRNQGPPIAEEALQQIFEPFGRGPEAERRPTGNGLGLGLFITREIVLAHGGDISVRSSAEQGTTFTVRLPRRRTPPAA